MTAQQIENTFSCHAPFGALPELYEELRRLAKAMAYGIVTMCPDSRERSLALTNLQQATMWANAAIAINVKQQSDV